MARMPTIVIEQQMSSIGIKVTHAQMHISIPQPTLEVSYELPEMSVSREDPKFRVNWKKTYNDIGHKDPAEFGRSNKSNAAESARNAMAEMVTDGDYMMDTTISGSRPAQLARSKMLNVEMPEAASHLGKPMSMPEVEWQRGSLDVSWTRGSLHIEVVGDAMPEIVIDPPFSVEVYLREKPYVKVYIDDGTLPDSSMGVNVDKKY